MVSASTPPAPDPLPRSSSQAEGGWEALVPPALERAWGWSPEKAKLVDPAAKDLLPALVRLMALRSAARADSTTSPVLDPWDRMAQRATLLHPRCGGGWTIAGRWLQALAARKHLEAVAPGVKATSPAPERTESRFYGGGWAQGLRETAAALSVTLAPAEEIWISEDSPASAAVQVWSRAVSHEAPDAGPSQSGALLPGERLWLLGGETGGLAGSLYQDSILRIRAGVPTPVDPASLLRLEPLLRRLRAEGLAREVRAVGEGGLMATLADWLVDSGPGRGAVLAVHPRHVRRRDAFLFGEDVQRLLVSVPAAGEEEIRAAAGKAEVCALPLGEVTEGIALALQVGGVVMAWRVEQLGGPAARMTVQRENLA